MHSKSLKIILLIISFSTLAAVVGFWLGRISQAKGPVVIYSDQERAEHYRSVIEKSDAAGSHRRELEREANMRPLVKAGPLLIRLNESNGEYTVYDDGEPIALKLTDGDETSMTYFGKSGRASVNVTLTYKRGTTELKECDFSTGEGDVVTGPITYSYGDIDGDGRFDRFGDHKAGKAYELKGLEWKLIHPAQPKDK